MEKNNRFYVSRKNGLTWVMALLMAVSIGVRIAVVCRKGAVSSAYVWAQVVLPVAASLLFALITIFDGQERFYKTAIPVALMALYFCFHACDLGIRYRYVILHWIVYLGFAVVYAQVSAGKCRWAMPLVLLFAVPLGFMVYEYWNALRVMDLPTLAFAVPNVLMLAGGMCTVFAIRRHNDGKYHPTWGDRPDGRLIRTRPPMDVVASYIMVERNDCSNLYEDSWEITAMERYIRQKRKEGMTTFGINHFLLAAFCRSVAKYPAINRFVSGQKVYSRGDDIQYSMTVKKEMKLDSPDSCMKVHLKPTDTPKDVYEKFSAAVDEIRNSPADSDFDNTARALTYLPGIFLKFTVWLLKTLDYFGMLPKFLLEVSPFHGSIFFTSMGSLGIPAIYHHLYNFGNLPIFIAFGGKYRKNEVLADGTVVTRKYIDIKVTMDERIADGYYYSTFLKHFKRLVAHPEMLDEPLDEVIQDVD